ncbi:hypothetical protein VCHA53O466_50471 [Vibrio chagasii]|nr:hypothetical protein VCHA53O466_50471 [Vibrio chagasii]
MKKIFLLKEYASDGISYDINRVLLASTNAQPLTRMAKECKILEPSSDFSVKEMVVSDESCVVLDLWLEEHSDLNYCVLIHHVNAGIGKHIQMIVNESITEDMRRHIYRRFDTNFKKKLDDARSEQRQKRLGYFWNYH